MLTRPGKGTGTSCIQLLKKKKKKKKLDWIFVVWPNRNKKSTGRHVALRVLGHIILTLNLCFYS